MIVIDVFLPELTFWLFLLNQGVTRQAWFASLQFRIWVTVCIFLAHKELDVDLTLGLDAGSRWSPSSDNSYSRRSHPGTYVVQPATNPADRIHVDGVLDGFCRFYGESSHHNMVPPGIVSIQIGYASVYPFLLSSCFQVQIPQVLAHSAS